MARGVQLYLSTRTQLEFPEERDLLEATTNVRKAPTLWGPIWFLHQVYFCQITKLSQVESSRSGLKYKNTKIQKNTKKIATMQTRQASWPRWELPGQVISLQCTAMPRSALHSNVPIAILLLLLLQLLYCIALRPNAPTAPLHPPNALSMSFNNVYFSISTYTANIEANKNEVHK